jgi:hypothetical protein
MANQDALSANGRIGNVIFTASWVHEEKSIKEAIAVEKPEFNKQKFSTTAGHLQRLSLLPCFNLKTVSS